MLPPASSSLSQFVDTYHLWSGLILLSLFGVYHILAVGVWHWFRFIGDANEAYYAYKTRRIENQRRYEQVAAALSNRAGAD